MSKHLTPGVFVSNPKQTDWGLGQIQSMVGSKVTVNFEHKGKLVINLDQVDLEIEFPA